MFFSASPYLSGVPKLIDGLLLEKNIGGE